MSCLAVHSKVKWIRPRPVSEEAVLSQTMQLFIPWSLTPSVFVCWPHGSRSTKLSVLEDIIYTVCSAVSDLQQILQQNIPIALTFTANIQSRVSWLRFALPCLWPFVLFFFVVNLATVYKSLAKTLKQLVAGKQDDALHMLHSKSCAYPICIIRFWYLSFQLFVGLQLLIKFLVD